MSKNTSRECYSIQILCKYIAWVLLYTNCLYLLAIQNIMALTMFWGVYCKKKKKNLRTTRGQRVEVMTLRKIRVCAHFPEASCILSKLRKYSQRPTVCFFSARMETFCPLIFYQEVFAFT